MKRVVNKIARYIIGIVGMLLLLFLACVANMGNTFVNTVSGIVFVLLMIALVLMVLTYAIHFVWMARDDRKKLGNVIVMSLVLIVMALVVSLVVKIPFDKIIKGIGCIILGCIIGQTSSYVYSLKEFAN